MRRLSAAVAALLLSTATYANAIAFKTGSGLNGRITVYPDFHICVDVWSDLPFTAVVAGGGELQGPGTQLGTVRYAQPFTGNADVHFCIPGSYANAAVGEAKFVLEIYTDTATYHEVQQCTVANGVVSCH